MRLIETTHLKTWAGSKPAESRFPYWVKQLICAVIPVDKIRFPSGDAVWVPGFDGVVTNGQKDRFVPTGLSVWEVSTGTPCKREAEKNYEKRRKDKVQDVEEGKTVEKLDRPDITFVFVTPLVWKDKGEWIAERKGDNIWNDVVVIDGVELQDWLEVATAINLQFAAELGIVPEVGLQTPDQAWDDWSYMTDPPASEELVIVGRDDQEKDLIGRLSAPPSTFTIRGHSPREAWGFALAALRRVDSEEERQSLYSRSIVTHNEEVASRLRHLSNHIILLKQALGQVSGHLSSRGCHVIIPEGNDARSEQNVIVLTRPTHRMFTEALGRMGLQEEEAEHATRACGLSVTILQRQRAHANFERPRWAEGQDVVHLLPALLAGRWNDRNEADRQILCSLAGSPNYATVERQLQKFLLVDEPPLQKINEMWALTAPVDAFELTARYLTYADLERFKDAFREVFGRIEPKVEVPPDEWLYYDIKGEKGHSSWLRSGMAEALLLIAERGSDARLMCVPSPCGYSDEVVRGLPDLNNDWRVLASIRDQYARLMEAAPGPFLDSLERLLEANADGVRRLFAEGKDIFSGGGMHTGLLWGLETVAWSPEYLPRVTLILARLANLDPGGQLANRPINSLREIFLWWHPGTNAPLKQRLAALDLVLTREPEVGWALLAELLPGAVSSVSHPTAKPRWKDFGDLPEDARTRRGQLIYVSKIVDRALECVGSDPERWRAILNSMRVFSATQQKKALARLGDIAKGGTPDDIKGMFWDILRDFIYEHRTFSDARWALPTAVLDQLDAVLSNLAPSDAVEHNRWLFDEWLPKLPSGEKDAKNRGQACEELRNKAVREILEKEGMQGIVRLGTNCKLPGKVAHAAVPLMMQFSDIRGLIEQAVALGEAGIYLAGQISGRAQQLHGGKWCEFVRKEAKAVAWPPAVTASLMIWWPDSRATWEEVEKLGEEVKAEYWHHKQVLVIEGSPEDQTYHIDRLIEVGRAAEAFDRIALNGKDVPSDVLLRVFDAAFHELRRAETAEEIRQLGLNSYDMRQFLDQLRKRSDIPREELARREYQALPLLGSLNARNLTIHEFMADDPDFFINVLCDVYLPAHRDKNQDIKPTPEEQARAQTAYRLLEGMELIPGQQENNDIDEAVLMRWIDAVRAKAAEVDRAAVADLKIGDILAHASAYPEDGGWPHCVVRNVIEKLAADDIDRGLMIERHNMRGVYSKALYEGGAQERGLAKQYRGWADISRARWPRTARVLEAIAEDWEASARQEDARAEQDKRTSD